MLFYVSNVVVFSMQCYLFVLLEGNEGLAGSEAVGEFEEIADNGTTICIETAVTLGGFGVGINRSERIGVRVAR